MRRKPSGQGGGGNYTNNNNGPQRKQRFQQSGGGNGGGHNQNRPRKNYTAMREKYLAQARDALSQGDRVLAENYFQHADHCYRMMVEEGYNTRNNHNNAPQTNEQPATDQQNNDQQADQGNQSEEAPQEDHDNVVAQLPAFLTHAIVHPIEDDHKNDHAVGQNWEE